MVNDKYVVKYLDPRTGKYEYATIKDVGDLQKLNTKVKTSIVDAINSISTDGIGGLRNDLDTIGNTIKSLEDGTLELGDFQSIDDVVSREIEDAINSLKLENSGLLQLTQEEIDTIVSNAESEYRDSIAASVRELETSKTDLEAAREKMTTIGQMLENADIDYSNLTQVVDDINLYITDVIEKTDFDMVNGIVSDYKTAVTQTQDGWGVDASKNMLSYLTGRVKSNETSLDVQHGLIQAKVGKDEFQYMTVDNLPAGKENMLHNTSDLRDWDFSSAFIFKSADDYRFTSIVQSDSAGENITGTTDELEQGATYAISAYVNVQNKNKEPGQEKYAPTDGVYTATVIIDGDTIELNNVVEDNSALDGWKRVSGTFIAKRTAKQDIKFYVTAFNRDTQVGYLSAPKLEKGSSATSWIPHIEDNVSTILSQNAVMRVLSDRITSSVEEVRETKGAFETATSTFDQMADGFELNTNKLSEVLDKYGEVTGVQTQQASELKVLNESITSKVWKQDINTTLDTINIDTSNRIVNSAFNIYSYDEQTGELKLDYWDNNTGFAIKKHSQSLDNYLYATRSNATSVNPISIKSSPFALRDGEKTLFNFEYLAVGNPLDDDNVFTLEMYDNNDVRVGLQEFRLSELKKEFLTAYDIGDSYKYNGSYIVKNSSVVKGTITLKLPKNGELWLTKIMFQNAGIGTIGWTPSSIDNQIIQSKLSTEINQLADFIELVATDERLDAISGLLIKKDGKIVISPEAIVSRVTSQELGEKGLITQTSLKQTEDNLRFDLVDKEGVIQTINASAEGLLIDFDKVHIDGEVIARMISAQAIDVTQGFRLTDNNGNTLLAVVNDNGTPTLSITKEFRVKFGEVNDKLDVTIVGVVEEYYYSVDPNEPISGRWTSTPDAFQGGDNRFIWKRTKIIYQSGDVSYYPSETGINITGSWEYEKESVTAEVVKALDSAEDAKALAVSEANQAMIDANKYADEQDALITQQVTTSVSNAISTADQAKQIATDSYNNAVAETERLVGEQTTAFNTKFEENATEMGTLSQAASDADAKAQDALDKAGANSLLLGTHQESLNTINEVSIPNINTSISNVMSEAESALSSAGAAMTEALKTDGKIATLKESVGKDIQSVSSAVDGKISIVNTTITDLDTKLSNSISNTSQALTNQISSASSKAQQALDEANKADGKIADYVTRNGLVSGTTVDSKINTATGEINKKITTVEGKIDGLQVGGRNFILNSGEPLTPRGTDRSGITTSTTEEGYLQVVAEPINGNYFYFTQLWDLRVNSQIVNNFKQGDDLTFSIDIKSPDSTDIPTLYVYGANNTYQELVGVMGTEFSRFHLTVNFKNSPIPVNIVMGIQDKSGTFVFRHPKIEKGNIATDWTPAPEDNYTQSEFAIFENRYSEDVKGINSTLTDLSNKKLDGTTYQNFYENDYKRTAQGVTDAWTAVNKIVDENGNSTDTFAKAVYDQNATRQKADFTTVTDDLVKTATYEAGIDGIKNSLSEVEGKIPTSVGGRNYLLNSGKAGALSINSNNGSVYPVTRGVENGVDWLYQAYNDGTDRFMISTYIGEVYSNKSNFGRSFSKDLDGYDGIITYSVDVMSEEPITLRLNLSGAGRDNQTTLVPNQWTRLVTTMPITDYPRPMAFMADVKDNENIPMGTKLYWKNYKIEKGNIATDYSLAPEDTLLESDFKSFQADYEQNAQGITSRLSTAENSITTNNQAFTTFKENEYKRTAERVSDTFTKSETTTMLGGKADASQLSNYLAKSTYERDAEQSKERFETIESDLGNISVGGRNLLQNTSDEWRTLEMSASSWYTGFGYNDNYKVEAGQTYTFSIIVDKVNPDDTVPINLHFGLGSLRGNYIYDIVDWRQNNIPMGKKVSLTYTVTEADTDNGARPWFAYRLRNEQKATHIKYKEAKLEKGTIATDWSPAVEDMANLSYVDSEITKSANAITTNLTSYAKTTDLNGLATETYADNKAVSEAGKVSSELTKYELKTGVDSKLSSMATSLRTETADKMRTVYTKTETETLLGKKADSSALNNYVQQATYESGIDGVSQSLTRVEGKVDGLQIGGRNLIPQSDFNNGVITGGHSTKDGFQFNGVTYSNENGEFKVVFPTNGVDTSTRFVFWSSSNKLNAQKGDKITLSFKGRTDSANNLCVRTGGTFTSPVTKIAMTSSDEIYTVTFEAPIKISNGAFVFWLENAGVVVFDWMKLELGSIATDWTPAPEDTLTQDEYKAFKSDYESTVEGITGQITSLNTSKLDGNTYTNFVSNEYKATADKATSAFTNVNKIIDANGNSTDTFAKAVYDRNATRQSADFKLVTDGLVKEATYTAGINGITESIQSVRGDINNLGARNYFIRKEENVNKLYGWSTGVVSGEIGSITSDLIEVKGGDTFSSNTLISQVGFYDSNKTYLGSLQGNGGALSTTSGGSYTNFTVPSGKNIYFMRVTFRNNVMAGIKLDELKVMLNKGNVTLDWSPAPEEMLGQADFQVFKGTYEKNDETIKNRLTSIDSGANGSILYNTNLALSTAQGNTREISSVKGKIGDLSGARNLLKESWHNSVDNPAIVNTNYGIKAWELEKPLELGKTYTFRLFGFSNREYFMLYTPNGLMSLVSGMSNGDSSVIRTDNPYNGLQNRKIWEKTFTLSQAQYNNMVANRVVLYNYPSSNSGNGEVYWATLVEGTAGIDWSPSLTDNLGKAEFTVFKNTYDETAQKIESRLTAIDSGKQGSVIYNANTALSTAQGNTKSITTLNTKVDGLKIGGRNLISGTDDLTNIFGSGYGGSSIKYYKDYEVTDTEWGKTTKATRVVLTNGSGTSGVFTTTSHFKMIFGKPYTVSFYVKNLGTNRITFSLNGLMTNPDGTGGQSISVNGGESGKFSATGYMRNNPDWNWFQILLYPGSGVTTMDFAIAYLQVEEGNFATDWTPAVSDQMGKAEFTLFKNDYDETAKGILSRLTAIDSSEQGSVVTRLNTTEKTAGENKNTLTKVNNIITIQDTRNDNRPPSWYRANYPLKTVQEFKLVTAIRDSNIPSTSGFGILSTTIVWSGTSGGTIQQVFTQNDQRYTRRGWSDDSGWSAWLKMTDQEDIKNFVDSTSTEYQTIRERSNLYERVIGSSSEAGVKQNMSRIVMTDSAFQTEVVDRQNLLTAMASGTGMTADPYFDKGANGIGVYDNGRTGTITVSRVKIPSTTTIPVPKGNDGYRLDITHGVSTTTSPYRGGIVNQTNGWVNGTVVVKFVALLPVGRSFNYHNNHLGTGYTAGWLTDNSGTGKWETYMYYYRFGTGTVSNFGHLSVSGESTAFTWYLSEYDIINVNETSASKITQLADNINLKVSKSDLISEINVSTEGVRIAGKNIQLDGNIYMTQYFQVPDANIKDLAVNKITGTNAQFTTMITKGLTADMITSTMIKADTALFNMLFSTTSATSRLVAQGAWITNANIVSLDASKINAGTIATARLDAGAIVTAGLTANVVKSSHIEAGTALVDKIFSTTAYITQLTSKTAFISSIQAINISASRITSGTLNANLITVSNLSASSITGGTLDANKVTINNLSVGSLTGFDATFMRTKWNNATGGGVSISDEGIQSLASDNSQVLIQNGRTLYRNTVGATLGSMGYQDYGASPYMTIQTSLGSHFRLSMRRDSLVGNSNDKHAFTIMSGGYEMYLNTDNIYLTGDTTIQRGLSIANNLSLSGGEINGTNRVRFARGAYLEEQSNGNTQLKSAGTQLQFYQASGRIMYSEGTRLFLDLSINMQGNGVLNQSDARIKTDIRKIEQDSLNIIKGTDFVNYKMISNGRETFGFIAQQMQKVAPHLIKDEDGTLAFDSMEWTQTIAHGLQQLSNTVDENDDKVNNRIKELESKIEMLELELKRARG